MQNIVTATMPVAASYSKGDAWTDGKREKAYPKALVQPLNCSGKMDLLLSKVAQIIV